MSTTSLVIQILHANRKYVSLFARNPRKKSLVMFMRIPERPSVYGVAIHRNTSPEFMSFGGAGLASVPDRCLLCLLRAPTNWDNATFHGCTARQHRQIIPRRTPNNSLFLKPREDPLCVSLFRDKIDATNLATDQHATRSSCLPPPTTLPSLPSPPLLLFHTTTTTKCRDTTHSQCGPEEGCTGTDKMLPPGCQHQLRAQRLDGDAWQEPLSYEPCEGLSLKPKHVHRGISTRFLRTIAAIGKLCKMVQW